MDQIHVNEPVSMPPGLPSSRAANPLAPEAQACPTCGRPPATDAGAAKPYLSPWIYALGRIDPRFPRLSVEREFAHATRQADTKGLTNRQALHTVLSKSENRYLVRQLCWVMTIQGLDTYILVPNDPADISLLVDALRRNPTPSELDVVIGARGPIAPAEMCNGLMVPIVAFDQIYSFDRDELIKAIPRPDSIAAEEFAPAAAELFDRIMQMADNTGGTDKHRALNYCALRYQAIYAATAGAFARSASLSAVDVRLSPVSDTRTVVDVIFSYTDRATDVVEKLLARVDVTEEFPFLVSKLSPYYDH